MRYTVRLRNLLRYVPGMAPLVASVERFERDHLALAEAHRALADAYHALLGQHQELERSLADARVAHDALERGRRALAQEHAAYRAQMERLTRPPFEAADGAEPTAIDGVPLPPPLLRYWVAATDDLGWFLEGGRGGARALEAALEPQGIAIGALTSILDFGCGCGRVLRHLPALTGAALAGSDLNPEAIRWCAERLGFGRFAVNGLAPPLAFADGQFDLIYAFSVFTHLPEPLQRPWIAELHRCLRPGGYLILSLHGDRYAAELTPAERAAYDQGELVVRDESRQGENRCGAYHPLAYVRDRLAADFTLLTMIPEGALGNPWQDLYLLQR